MSRHDFDCPYCGEPFVVCHDDGHGYDEGKWHHDHCRACDKHFVFTTSISFSFEPEKADCLNGSPHAWKTTTTFPKKYSRMRCSMCDDERQPTDAERDQFGLKDAT